MITKDKQEMVSFPISVFESAETKDELEDWLISQNPEIMAILKQALQDEIDGKGIDLETLKKELCIK
ncbi:MAG: hypothetical protein HQK91_13470 [Nitrospirae bacterium]|nr:hypothetical protein [Nitrospirota bacterium]